MQWLPLSRHTAQTSLGTTRFFLSIHLPHLSCIIPCSYWALTWVAVLPTCMTSYEISVRQTRDLPVSWYIPHIQLPSDSISRWTPLPSAISFPLPGGFGTLTLKKRAPPGALTQKSPPGNPDGDFITCLDIAGRIALPTFIRSRCQVQNFSPWYIQFT